MDDPRFPEENHKGGGDDDQKGQNQDLNWELFVNDASPEKCEPKSREIMCWVQSKMIKLGGIVASGVNISHSDNAVAVAALRLGITLLQHGNQDGQKLLYTYLVDSRDENFFASIEDTLNGANNYIKEWRLALKKQMEISTKSGTSKQKEDQKSGDPPPMDADTKACSANLSRGYLVLRYLQLCMEGHNQDFQNFIRQQPGNVVSYNLCTPMAELLATLAANLEFCFTHQYGVLFPLLRQLFSTMTEMLQGSCWLNQVTSF